MKDKTGHLKTEFNKKIIRAMSVTLSLWLVILAFPVFAWAENKLGTVDNSQNEVMGASPGSLAGGLGNNIVRVTASLVYEEQTLEEKTSTGFFISTSRQDAYIATTCDVLFSSEEIGVYKERIRSEQEENYRQSNINIDERYYISFGGDIQTYAERTNIISEKRDILVLKANSLVGSEESLKVTYDEKILENVFLAGYSADSNEQKKYDVDNMTVYPGTVMESSEQRADECIRLKIVGENLNDTNLLGAPIINKNGCVIGIFSGEDSGQYALAIPIRYLKELLDFQGVAVSESVIVSSKKRPVYIYVLVIAAVFLVVFTLMGLLLDAKNRLLAGGRVGFRKRRKERRNPRLTRIRTDETISLNKEKFFVGTNQKQCDYIIENSKSVEPVQFCILHEKNKYYIVNLARYTDTTLNDKEIEQKIKVRLKNRAEIQAGNERFIFLMD